MKTRLLIIIAIYGVFVTFLSVWQWPNEGIHFILNLPGNILGEIVYEKSIDFIGDPTSSQAHFTIPWFLQVPQVFVMTSMVFWIGIGMLLQLVSNNWKEIKN